MALKDKPLRLFLKGLSYESVMRKGNMYESEKKLREIALQALFQFDFTKNDDENLIEMLIKKQRLNQQSILLLGKL